MFQRLLVPLDEGQQANQALLEAIRIAEDESAQVRLIHAIGELPGEWTDSYFTQEMLLDELRRVGQWILADAASFANGLGMQVEMALLEAPDKKTADIIVEDALRWRSDLIVMGTHGRYDLHRLRLGSIAERVARCSPMPLLLIHSNAEI